MFNGRETQYSDEEITSTSFWGNINIGEFQRQRAIPLQISIDLIYSALVYAMQSTEFDLEKVTKAYQQQGFTHVSQVPSTHFQRQQIVKVAYAENALEQTKADYLNQNLKAEEIDERRLSLENTAQFLYKKAVFARAKHELLPEFATISARELHEKRDVISEQKQLLSEATQAIRALKGKRRGSVHLI